MKATRRTVLGWILAACITPSELITPELQVDFRGILRKSYREQIYSLFPDLPPLHYWLDKLNDAEDKEVTFEWRLNYLEPL